MIAKAATACVRTFHLTHSMRRLSAALGLYAMASLSGCVGPAASAPAEVETPESAELTVDSDGGSEVEAQLALAACTPGSEPVAQDVRLRQLALYQVVKIPLVQDGVWQTLRPAPVVQNKQALLRAFVEPLPARLNRALRGVLTLENGSTRTRLTADLTPSGSSTDEALASTLNFKVAASLLGATTRFSIALVDPACQDTRRNPNARFPATGTQALEATRIGRLRIALLPIVINGLAPDTSSAQLNAMRATLMAHYPVPAVDLTVRPALTSSVVPQAGNAGWVDVLELVQQQRAIDQPGSDVYYYGLVRPRATYQQYCPSGCVTELALLNSSSNASQRVAVGLGYLSTVTTEAMSHALGHVHGRRHTPCIGESGIDPNYPYPSGNVGVWGWDPRTNKLVAPTTKDVMSYCTPIGVSDYTYNAFATRSQLVNTTF